MMGWLKHLRKFEWPVSLFGLDTAVLHSRYTSDWYGYKNECLVQIDVLHEVFIKDYNIPKFGVKWFGGC
jgi:hypothetical protein